VERQVEPVGGEPADAPPFRRIDLSEAYAAVRRRAKSLRRRRRLTTAVAVLVLSGVLTVIGTYYVSQIPLPDALALPATTTVYYSDGTTVLARLGAQNRTIVDPDTLPWHVAAAVVAAEDMSFWSDSATLISRQYARAATDVDVASALGRARLLVMSWKLEDQYRKTEILGFYLNTVYFGRGAYGIEAAARAYFGISATRLTLAQSVVLAGVIESPGDGRFDPSVDLLSARSRFATVLENMVALGSIDQATAERLPVPRVAAYDAGLLQSGMDLPTGHVVLHVLAELRRSDAFRDKPGGFIENGGYTIVTTIDARAQDLLERAADETVADSPMYGQPDNLQAAAVVVEPGTGRVLAYFGGHDGTGADYAGWYLSADGVAVGYGAHPPGQTFGVYALAAALGENISVRSRWDSPSTKQFPRSGRTAANPVLDPLPAPCQPVCDLVEASTGGLNIPFFALTEQIGPAKVIDAARATGIDSLWVPESGSAPRRRVDLRPQPGAAVSPQPFGPDVALGRYPVTVLDQANAMATLAAGGRRSEVHFVRRVTKDGQAVHVEPAGRAAPAQAPMLATNALADLTWALSQNPAGQLADGRPSATKTGEARLRDTTFENAHAWIVGYTPGLGLAVWIGNQETEFPLRDKFGARVSGAGLPAEIYRTFLEAAHARLRLPAVDFPPPSFTGDTEAGDAP
jgi:membrane peptidoglycan carboxypeptidase